MGRPLNKRFFGPTSNEGKQLILSHVWLEDSTEAETGFWVVRQVGTGRYQVTNGIRTGVVKLVDALPDAPGEGCIEVIPFGSEVVEYAKKIHNRTVVTFDDNVYRWSVDGSTEEGEASLPFEVWSLGSDLDKFNEGVSVDELFTAINEAIAEDPTVFFTEDALEAYTGIVGTSTANANNRKKAAISGVLKWVELYGPYSDEDELKAVIEFHAITERHKADAIYAFDTAGSVAEFKSAIETHLPILVADRQQMIADLIGSGVQAAIDHAAELQADTFTTVFKTVVDMIEDGNDMTEFYTEIFAARQNLSGSKFFGTARLITAIEDYFAA